MFEPSWRTTVEREEVSIILGALLLVMMASYGSVFFDFHILAIRSMPTDLHPFYAKPL